MSDKVTEQIIGIAIAVHRELGPGLLESTYEACMAYEMTERGQPFVRQKPLSVVYKQKRIDAGYRIDFLVADSIIVEIKSVERLDAIHAAQILTNLKLSGSRIGLLINFNVPLLKDGIRRFVNGLENRTQRPQRPLW